MENARKRCRVDLPSKVLVAALTAFGGMMIYILVGRIMELRLYRKALDGVAVHGNELFALQQRGENQEMLFYAVGISSMIAFLVFFVQVLKVAHDDCGAEGLDGSPGFAAASFFIPVLNWFKPAASLQQAWRAMHLDAGASDWAKFPGSGRVGLWWCVWLCSFFFRMIGMSIDEEATDPSVLYDQSVKQLMLAVFLLVLTAVTLAMVRSVTARAQAKWAQMKSVPRAQVVERETPAVEGDDDDA